MCWPSSKKIGYLNWTESTVPTKEVETVIWLLIRVTASTTLVTPKVEPVILYAMLNWRRLEETVLTERMVAPKALVPNWARDSETPPNYQSGMQSYNK